MAAILNLEKEDMEDKKFVVALNRGYDLARLTSGLGHVTAGLVGSLASDVDALRFLEYESKDGDRFPWISDWPFIILKARGGQLKSLRQSLTERSLPCVCYLDTMLEGGTVVEQKATRERTLEEIDVLAVATFGDRVTIDELTKKFSLWR
jgi:hypothetical protein